MPGTLGPALAGCVKFYSAGPIRAWVVDAETKRPLAGVNVVANWQLEGGLEGGTPLGQMKVMETVTDRAGQFSFPGWGPKLRPVGYPWVYQNARLKTADPQLLLFKSGYRYLALYNYPTAENMAGQGSWVRTSDWNGKTIQMRRFKGSLEEYADHLAFLDILLRGVATLNYAELPRNPCKWKKVPLMILATGKQNEQFKHARIRFPALTLYDELLSDEKYFSEAGCGSVRAFFRNYEQ